MQSQYKKTLFIFRRDLRLNDNTALQHACMQSQEVIPCFIFDPAQVGEKNKYRSMNAMQHMIESLVDLQKHIHKAHGKLYFFHGDSSTIIDHLIKETRASAAFLNRDYTPFSKERDKKIERVCIQNDIAFHAYDDIPLHSPDTILKKDQTPYGVFTAFYNRARVMPVAKPKKCSRISWYMHPISGALSDDTMQKTILGSYANDECLVRGGRTAALKTLHAIKDYKAYQKTRDFPAQATTHVSAYLKFGTLSIREVYYHIQDTLGIHHPLLRQLYWRDFWMYIAYHNPHVFGQAYHKRYDGLTWDNNKTLFKKWCQGATGFPIVDAGMRQLNTTGFMHNRVRMIVASFLVKDLHIDWRWGERYFAQQLVDYDPCLNNGNWQWAASTGCDAQPYFRIFNPWLQQKKYDPECTYIKQWIPELTSIDAKIIHTSARHTIPHYPRPCVDHALESAKAKVWYKQAR